MQDAAVKALKLLDLLARQSGRQKRLTELLKDPGSGTGHAWFFHVPACFNDALDLRETERIVNGKSISTWTQGQEFAFYAGDVLYDTAEAYRDWSGGLGQIRLCVQVKAAVPRSAGGDGGAKTSGMVTFDVLKPTGDRSGLALSSSKSLTQEAFVRLLITGEGLASREK
jgi:hypothetical protein